MEADVPVVDEGKKVSWKPRRIKSLKTQKKVTIAGYEVTNHTCYHSESAEFVQCCDDLGKRLSVFDFWIQQLPDARRKCLEYDFNGRVRAIPIEEGDKLADHIAPKHSGKDNWLTWEVPEKDGEYTMRHFGPFGFMCLSGGAHPKGVEAFQECCEKMLAASASAKKKGPDEVPFDAIKAMPVVMTSSISMVEEIEKVHELMCDQFKDKIPDLLQKCGYVCSLEKSSKIDMDRVKNDFAAIKLHPVDIYHALRYFEHRGLEFGGLIDNFYEKFGYPFLCPIGEKVDFIDGTWPLKEGIKWVQSFSPTEITVKTTKDAKRGFFCLTDGVSVLDFKLTAWGATEKTKERRKDVKHDMLKLLCVNAPEEPTKDGSVWWQHPCDFVTPGEWDD